MGASTLAVNLSVAASKRSGEPVLLADLDFDTGLIGFLLNLASPFSVTDLMEKLPQLDEDLWFQLLSKTGNLHVLASGRESRGMRPDAENIEAVVNFARKLYRIVCIDLPGNLDPCSLGLLKHSDRIIIVSTPEIPALHLARERYEMLSGLGLSDRLTVLLNRWDGKSPLSLSEAVKMLGAPVFATVPNDYQAVHRALTAGQPVNSGSRLALRFAELADGFLTLGEPAAPPKRKQPLREALRSARALFR
ncbi:MAG: hypothetical protein GY953_58225 [bacterium]|nr:hypothetical protein [bacterium]